MCTQAIDCLFIGYSGKKDEGECRRLNHIILEYNVKLESPFNAAIAYLGSYIKRRGLSFDYINSYDDEKEQLSRKLKNDIKTIAISTTLCNKTDIISNIIKFIKTYNSSAKIIVGGPFIVSVMRMLENNQRQFVLRRINADFYIDSYIGEASLVDIIYSVKNNIPYEGIYNIYYQNNNKYMATKRADEKYNIEGNMVDWTLFTGKVGKCISIRTSISCPFSCSFCTFPQNAGEYTVINIQKIKEELDAVRNLGTVEIISFIDDTFNFPQERFKDILRTMIKNDYNFRWHSYFKCQNIDEETVILMKESGCDGVWIGFESGSQDLLQRMNKQATIQQYKYAHTMLQKYGIITLGLFIVGFPGETIETIKHTVDFINDIRPTFYKIVPWYCDTRTAIWNEKEKYQLVGANESWSHKTMDSATTLNLISEMKNQITGSIEWCVQPTYIFQSLNAGVDLEHLKMVLSKIK